MQETQLRAAQGRGLTDQFSPAELASLQKQLDKLGPAATFPWHSKQEAALRAATNVILLLGGNQSGKSLGALGIVSRLIRREGPVYSRLRRPEGRPLRVWVAPQTLEKYRSLWESRLVNMAFAGMDFDYRRAPEPVFTWRDERGGGSLWGKSQDQGFMAFEGDPVDLCALDEEPEDYQVYSSIRTRFSTTNGVVVLAYTPLSGLTWTWDALVQPAMKDEYKIGEGIWRKGNDITVIQQGMADNPESVAGGGVALIQNDPAMSPAEKAARLYGQYGYTEGILIPEWSVLKASDKDNPYLLEKLPADRPYAWLLTLDPNKKNGALLTAFDPDGNRYYCAEHYAENLPDPLHARSYRRMLSKFNLRDEDIEVWADPGGAGAQAILNLSELGFFAQAVKKDAGSVAASIKLLRRHAWIDPDHKHPVTGVKGAPHVYFLRSLKSEWKDGGQEFSESRLMYEFRQYRQKADAAPDTPIKKKDDLVDCARYAELVRMAEPEMTMSDPIRQARGKLDSISRGEAEDFDKLLDAMEKRGYLKRAG